MVRPMIEPPGAPVERVADLALVSSMQAASFSQEEIADLRKVFQIFVRPLMPNPGS